jgi:hypothetical protein
MFTANEHFLFFFFRAIHVLHQTLLQLTYKFPLFADTRYQF